MTMCAIHDAGSIELLFYGELPDGDRAEIERHLLHCRVCAHALEELKVIRSALAVRPTVDGPASGDWTAFMGRLDEAVRVHASTPVVVPFVPRRPAARSLRRHASLAVAPSRRPPQRPKRASAKRSRGWRATTVRTGRR